MLKIFIILGFLTVHALALLKIRDEFLPEPVKDKFPTPVNESRIVGGAKVPPFQRKFQASLQTEYGRHFCGATIIDTRYVLTAAHCCDGFAGRRLKIVVGRQHLRRQGIYEQVLYSRKIHVHEYYNRRNIFNDICLIQVSQDIRFNKAVQKVNLPRPLDDFDGQAKVSGWGTLAFGGQSSPELQEVVVPIVPSSDCKGSYGENAIITTMLCAGEENHDSCQGDSGGPLTCGPDFQTLCGVVSWGRGCAMANFPGVYTKVSHYIDWIRASKAKMG